MINIEQTIRTAFTYHQCVAKKESNAALLARVTRSMAKPRLVKSARESKRGPKLSKIERRFQRL